MTGLLQRDQNNNTGSRRDEIRENRGQQAQEHSASKHGQEDRSDTDGIVEALEQELIPRLVMSCRCNGKREPLSPAAEPGLNATQSVTAQVEEFANLLIWQDINEISSHLTALREQGASPEWLFMELMGPTAKYLGHLWEEDQASIVDVTLAVGRLQHAVRELSPTLLDYGTAPDQRRRALLLPMPGEQHTFGMSLLMQYFRSAGWDLWGWPMIDDGELMSIMRHERFAVVGISVSAQVNLSGLAALIKDLRRMSNNPSLGVMVGGPVFMEHPELAKEVGADASAMDAPQAVLQAEALFGLQQ